MRSEPGPVNVEPLRKECPDDIVTARYNMIFENFISGNDSEIQKIQIVKR